MSWDRLAWIGPDVRDQAVACSGRRIPSELPGPGCLRCESVSTLPTPLCSGTTNRTHVAYDIHRLGGVGRTCRLGSCLLCPLSYSTLSGTWTRPYAGGLSRTRKHGDIPQVQLYFRSLAMSLGRSPLLASMTFGTAVLLVARQSAILERLGRQWDHTPSA
nr:hypothetical protein CFP56_03286 [Quercus suber]